MQLPAFATPGRFFRGNVHTHSTRSDGRFDPAEVCRRYREQGYDFLCISDHFLERYNFPVTDTRAHRTDLFTTIIGAEVHTPATAAGENWHILAVGLPLDFPPAHLNETGPEIAMRCKAAGAFVVIAHPEWYCLTSADAATIDCADAVEIYNHTSQVRSSRGGGAYFLDMLLSEGRRINALACDDAHFTVESDPDRDAFGGWIMVKAARNEPDALLAAMRAGHYYSSQGPQITDVAIDDGEIAIRCSPSAQVIVVGPGSRHVFAAGEHLTDVRLPLAKFAETWCRIVVMDETGKCAWSNPIYPADREPR
jgi:hypothetical protein